MKFTNTDLLKSEWPKIYKKLKQKNAIALSGDKQSVTAAITMKDSFDPNGSETITTRISKNRVKSRIINIDQELEHLRKEKLNLETLLADVEELPEPVPNQLRSNINANN